MGRKFRERVPKIKKKNLMSPLFWEKVPGNPLFVFY
jgi:hypothetical protein